MGPRRPGVRVRLVAAIFVDRHGDSLLLSPPAGSLKNALDDQVPSLLAKLWHFPTASANRDSAATLRHLLAQQFQIKNLPALTAEPLPQVRHTVTYRKIEVLPFLIRTQKLPRISGAKTIELSEVVEQPISNLTRKVARAALKRLAATATKPDLY